MVGGAGVGSSGAGAGSDKGLHALLGANVPQLYLAAAASAHELALAAALQVYVCDPLAVLFPHPHHGCVSPEALVVRANGAVAEAGDKDVPLDLVGCERGDARAGAGEDVLHQTD